MGWKQKVFWVVLTVALVVVYSILFSTDANAESVVVSFNDAEQLAAISDSIVGVCDTVSHTWELVYQNNWSKTLRRKSCSPEITCRELVSRTVVEHYYHGITRWLIANGDTIWVDATDRGTAIITWREAKDVEIK
jgi:hypothetical protein